METCRLPAHPPTSSSTTNTSTKDDGLKAFLPPGFSTMEEYLVCLKSFLSGCEPVTDLMIVDYFTTNSWETRMPQSWREAFECPQGKLSSLDLMRLVSLGHLRDFKEPAAGTLGDPLAYDAGGVQDWPESLKDFVRMVKALSINRTLDPDYAKFKDTLDIHLIPGMSPKKLHEVEILSGLMASTAKEHSIGSVIDLGAGQGYLSRVLAFQHQLCVLGVDSNTIQTCGAQTTQKRTEKLFVNKSKLKNASGKGRNSRPTTKQQNRRSATTDAAVSATAAGVPAETETGTEAVAEIEPEGPAQTVTTIAATEITASAVTAKLDASATTEVCPKSRTAGMRSRSSSPTGSSGSTGPCKRSSRTKKPKVKKDKTATAEIIIPSSGLTGCGSPATTIGAMNGTPDCNRDGAAKPTTTAANDPSLATTPGSNFQLQHITHHITAATLPTLLKEHFPRKPKPQPHQDATVPEHINGGEAAVRECPDEDVEGRWTLCGLHACGDLTSNMIKLYLESSATCLFSVGCCYHWITERYDKAGNIAISDGSHGFPLSAAFNHHKCHLGEHAKMIACQSPERWLEHQKETEDAIHGHYFRALLHKLMVERGLYPGPPAIAPVLGRMGKHRLKGFPHYLTTAVNRLRLPTDKITPEDAQAAYDQFLDRDLYRIGILWALRTMLGPLFEGMILLDRATFLYENIIDDGVEGGDMKKAAVGGKKASVQLIAGFDVVESPRNMILVALKD
ncbi:Methyltransferase-like protein 25 [Mortierella hygrophila]|uniref:Methyltransferase-like protein 25 n=1 Tax=Mortierella hygrophila TaxID=979708 RepID=A0A9P6JZ84_9FUNG|nr:Methyltransferase-like protein 25 [Mortierella hygrophila]